MEPKGRCTYVQTPAGAWVPWQTAGNASPAGQVVLFSTDNVALATNFGGDSRTFIASDRVLWGNAIAYGIDATSGAANPASSGGNNVDDVVAVATGVQRVLGSVYGFDGATWDRIRSFAGNADAITAPTLGLLGEAGFLLAFNGTTYDRLRTASAANVSAANTPAPLLTSLPGDWSINHTPAANTQATITRAAGAAGVRHVCTSISATLIGLTTGVETTVLVNLRDGATGAGTILWSTRLLVIASGETGISISGLNIFGTAATAMTLEFAAAGGANTFESVAVTGHDVI